MNNLELKLISIITIFYCSCTLFAQNESLIIDNFNHYNSNQTFPNDWQYLIPCAKGVYSIIKEDNNQFLRALSKNNAVNIGKKIKNVDIKQYPILKWRWRLIKHPENSLETNKNLHDSALGVYIFFEKKCAIVPKYIKYIWSRSLKPGTRFFYKKNRAIVVLRSGENQENSWFEESVNFVDDFIHFYKKKPKCITGISLLTDSDATKSMSEGDYDDFILSH